MTSDGVEASTRRSESKRRPVKVDNRCQLRGSMARSPFCAVNGASCARKLVFAAEKLLHAALWAEE